MIIKKSLRNINCGVLFETVFVHIIHQHSFLYLKKKGSPITDPEWPRGFQEVKVPRFHDNGTGWW